MQEKAKEKKTLQPSNGAGFYSYSFSSKYPFVFVFGLPLKTIIIANIPAKANMPIIRYLRVEVPLSFSGGSIGLELGGVSSLINVKGFGWFGIVKGLALSKEELKKFGVRYAVAAAHWDRR